MKFQISVLRLCALILLSALPLHAQRLMTDLSLLGSVNELRSGATFTVKSGATFVIESGATFTVPAAALTAAAADGTTKGVAAFTAADFNASAGVISIDYTNAQAADSTHKGLLTSADWTAFNAKESALTFSTGLTRTTNTITVNPTQNITRLSNLTSNGIVHTSGSDGTLSSSAVDLASSDVTGILPIAKFATGTPNGSKFVRDDGVLATPAGGGTVTHTGGALTSNAVVIGAGTDDVSPLASLGTAGQVLTSAGAGSPPAFAAAATSDLVATLVASEVSITGATTLTSGAFGKMHVCTGTSADYTVGLPAVSGNAGKIIGLRMSMALTKLVTLDGNSSETIDTATTRIMWAGESAILLCDGTTWTKIAGRSRPMYASSERTTAVAISGAGTTVAVPVNSMISEANNGMVDTTNGKVFIRRPARYVIDAFMSFEDLSHAVAGAQSYCAICINSTTAYSTGPSLLAVVPTSTSGGITYSHVVAPPACRLLAAGDYLALAAEQNTGNSMNTRTIAAVRPHLNVVEQCDW